MTPIPLPLWGLPRWGWLDFEKASDREDVVNICIGNVVPIFALSGGEPTLKQGLEKLISYMREQLGLLDLPGVDSDYFYIIKDDAFSLTNFAH